MHPYENIVVGGGIIGAAIAFELGERGARVLLLDRQEPGREASWAAAGMLAPGPEYSAADALVALGKASFELYPEFVRRVEEKSGADVGFRRQPSIHLYFGENAEQERESAAARFAAAGIRLEKISNAEARRLEPHLTPLASAAALSPDEGRVDNCTLTQAVLAAAARSGAEIRGGAGVKRLLINHERCAGVETATEKIPAPCVVVAAGAYCPQIEGLAELAPTRPIRGQMLALRPSEAAVWNVVRSERGYLVPREDGRLIAGSTLEDAGYEKRLTPAGLREILDAVTELVPQLADAAVVESWCGWRPDTPDHLPLIGPADIAGLFVATGHFRNGILLAPATAKYVAEWIVRGQASCELAAFNARRFLGRSVADGSPASPSRTSGAGQ